MHSCGRAELQLKANVDDQSLHCLSVSMSVNRSVTAAPEFFRSTFMIIGESEDPARKFLDNFKL